MAVFYYVEKKYNGDQEKVIKETQYFRDHIGALIEILH